MSSLATPPTDVAPPSGPGPLDMLRLVARFNLHPELDLHPSWLPAEWPARHRSVTRLGPAGRAVLGDMLRRRKQTVCAPIYNFDSPLKRLVLLDSNSLRKLAVYVGLSVHSPLLKIRNEVGAQVRRQARRFDRDAVDFIIDRVPQTSAFKMHTEAMELRPSAAGRTIVSRGYRLLVSALAPEGETVVRRLQHKMPRRVASLNVPPLKPRQSEELNELMLMCIVPERLPQWDWLF